MLIAIASGKGGVGKTWFAITAAHALARDGRRVLLFDADLGLANVDIQLGLLPARDLASVLAGEAGIGQAATHFAPGGFSILAGQSGSGALAGVDPAHLDALLDALAAEAARYDVVLMDLGAGLDRAVRRMAARADRLAVIVTEEPTSLTDAYAVLKLHAADRAGATAEARVVVNQVATPASGRRVFDGLHRACVTFLGAGPRLAGTIRRDDHVRDAIRRQTPLLTRHPGCAAAADVEAAAQALVALTPVTAALAAG